VPPARPFCYLFFFQAEDGIRDFHVTGVQTCALPILRRLAGPPGRLVLPTVLLRPGLRCRRAHSRVRHSLPTPPSSDEQRAACAARGSGVRRLGEAGCSTDHGAGSARTSIVTPSEAASKPQERKVTQPLRPAADPRRLGGGPRRPPRPPPAPPSCRTPLRSRAGPRPSGARLLCRAPHATGSAPRRGARGAGEIDLMD